MSSTARRGWAGKGSTTAWRKTRMFVLQRDGWQCLIRGPRCTGTATEVDHIRPLADGGTMHDVTGLRAACAPCNRGRRDSPPPAARATQIETRTLW